MTTTRTPVVFIHGLWLHATSWAPWAELFSEAGYAPVAPGWPGDSDTVEASRANPDSIADHGIDDVTSHYASIIDQLPARPILIGHSFGGMIAEKLLGLDYGAAAIGIDAAQIKGVLPLPLSPHHGVFPDGLPEILTVDPKAEHDLFGMDFEGHYRGRWTSCDGGWHTDLTPAVNPPSVSILRAEAVPSYGGDTQWASLTAAYDGLSSPLQDLACELRAERAFFAGCQMVAHDELDASVLAANREHPLAAVHPVVRVIPETGKRALFVNPASTSRIMGVTTAESHHLLGLFFEEAARPEYTVRHQWRADDVAIWDNRVTAHLSSGDAPAGEPRRLHRVTIMGDRPVGPDGFTSEAVAGDPFYPLGPEGE